MKLVVNNEIHLSEIQPSDKKACVEHLQEKEIYDRTLRIPHPYTEQDFDQFMELVKKKAAEQGEAFAWAIRKDDGHMIGGLGFDNLIPGKSHRAEIGYWLAKPYWGRGITTAVVGAACAHVFSQYGLVKISAHVFAGNTRSARVLEKCGFELEGYLRKHHLKDGRYLDAQLYALLK
jgi:RimJ/RimL family protein N-acetyltransferase